ncbi:MAG: ribosome-associated translation inhibitor RaiA [Candidatus Moraniibacteriota bacterium]
MNMNFLAKGMELTSVSRAYIEKRLGRLEKLVSETALFEIEVDQDKKGLYRVEVMIDVEGKLYRADEVSESVEGSADLVVDELERQLTHEKDRLTTLERRGARSIKKKLVIDEDARF